MRASYQQLAMVFFFLTNCANQPQAEDIEVVPMHNCGLHQGVADASCVFLGYQNGCIGPALKWGVALALTRKSALEITYQST